MKNPFKKRDKSALTGAIIAGAAIAGGLAWLFFTESGKRTLDDLKASLKEKGKDLAAGFISGKTGLSRDITKPATDAMVD